MEPELSGWGGRDWRRGYTQWRQSYYGNQTSFHATNQQPVLKRFLPTSTGRMVYI